MPTINFKAIETKNEENLKKVKSGAKIKYMYSLAGGKPLVLIGAGHDPKITKELTDSNPYSGEIEVLRETIVGKGELKVTGCKANRSQFDQAMAKITKKKVTYV
jgi:hypothetical protein